MSPEDREARQRQFSRREILRAMLSTLRQAIYVHAMNLNSAYTPQAIVGGRKEFVGSNGAAMDAAKPAGP